MTIDDFQFQEDVALTRRARLWRARRIHDGSSVIVKSVSRMDDVASSRCRNHYTLTCSHNLQGVAKGLFLIEEPDKIHLVMEDAGNASLHAFLINHEYDIDTLLSIAEQVADALDTLHSERILHRDLSLANIVVRPEDGRATIVDLGLAVQLQQNVDSLSLDVMEGTLAYISPEQTGRLRRPVDYRSDLYSLGAVLYHLFTGAPPFVGSDALEVMHAHVTRIPTPPHRIKSSIPQPLNHLIMRLLEKEPHVRYQSAFGVAEDLRRIGRWLRSTDVYTELDLQYVSTSVTFKYPNSVVGRDAEIDLLRSLVKTAMTMNQQLVLLSGIAGSGKSMIIRGFVEEMPRNGVITTNGKYEQYTSGQPLTGLGHAMENIVRGILRMPTEDVERWRGIISSAVGEDIDLLSTIIPILPHLAHSSGSVPITGAQETRIRLIASLGRLIEAVAKGAGGLVLVLDDLHWADEATFDVIDLVLTTATHIPVAIIGTYRTEANLKPEHPVLVWPQAAELKNRVTMSAVMPLDYQSVQHIVTDSLQLTDEQAAPLAHVLMLRTSGHPLFVNQYLAYLVESSVVQFQRQVHRWAWSESRLREVPVQFGVADVIQARFAQLPVATQNLLSLAAVIGTEFNLSLISRILDSTVESVTKDLQSAMGAGLTTMHELPAGMYGAFVHDRVQETAVGCISPEDLKSMHASIVKTAIGLNGALADALTVFELGDHIIQAGDILRTPDFIQTNIHIMHEAAQKARQAGALREALAYAQKTRDLIGTDGWQSNHELYSDASVIAATAAGALGEFELSHTLFDECLVHTPDGIHAAKIIELKSEVYTRQGLFHDLMLIGYKGLAMLGIQLQANPKMLTLGGQLLGAYRSLTSQLISDRRSQVFSVDERLRIADSLLFQLSSAGYNFSQEMMGHLACTRGILAAKQGHTASTIDAYCLMGMVFLTSGMFKKAVALGELSLSLVDRSTDNAARARASYINGAYIFFWSKPLAIAINTFESGIEYAMRSGSQFHVYWGEGTSSELRAFAGMPLAEQNVRILAGLENLHRVYQRTDNIPWTSHYFQAAIARVMQVYNPSLKPASELLHLIDNEQELLDEIVKSKDATAMCSWSLGTIRIALATDNLALARTALQRYSANKHGGVSSWMQCEIELYTALIVSLAAQSGGLSKADNSMLRQASRRMRGFAKKNPTTFQSRAFLVDGIVANTSGNADEAFHLFQRAAQCAHTENNLYLEALALELSALAAENTVMSGIIGVIRQKAARTYRLYGATTLAEKLEAQRILDHVQPDVTQRVTVTHNMHSSTAPTVSVHRYAFDIDSIFKASNAIAGEIVHHDLVKRLLTIVLENAGADEGALLINVGGTLMVEATLGIEDDSFNLHSEPYTTSNVICKSAVNLVNRTNEPIVADEAFVDPDYSADSYVQTRGVRSLMVLPILHKGMRIGLLHLVNTQVSSAFTPERLEVVQLLTSQIAVSLENARLYDEQRATLEAAGRFVPMEFLDALGSKSIRDVNLGEGIRVPITVLFVDIRQFTSLSEQMTADDTFAFLNEYLKVVEPVIRSNHGFVDKYVGDAVMALFPDHPVDAVRAGIAIQDALQPFNLLRTVKGAQPIKVGIGIHTGDAMLGTVGTGDRMDTTVIGDTVNIAARLEELTKHNNATILISEDVRTALPPGEFEIVERGTESIRGRVAPIMLFEISKLQRT